MTEEYTEQLLEHAFGVNCHWVGHCRLRGTKDKEMQNSAKQLLEHAVRCTERGCSVTTLKTRSNILTKSTTPSNTNERSATHQHIIIKS